MLTLEIPLKQQLMIIGAQQQMSAIKKQAEEAIANIWTTVARGLERDLELPVGFISGQFSINDNKLVIHNHNAEDLPRGVAKPIQVQTSLIPSVPAINHV